MSKKVLLVSAGLAHPPLLGRFWLRRCLSKANDFYILSVSSMEALTGLDLEWFQGMILYFHHQRISQPALQAFESFVQRGGGVLAIHSPTASFKHQPAFCQLLGGCFREHGPVEPFTVQPVDTGGGIFAGIPAFSVKDELYLHDLAPDIQVHFTTHRESGPAPMVWTRRHGQGRVCYTCPGHTSASMRLGVYQDLILRALSWVSGAFEG